MGREKATTRLCSWPVTIVASSHCPKQDKHQLREPTGQDGQNVPRNIPLLANALNCWKKTLINNSSLTLLFPNLVNLARVVETTTSISLYQTGINAVNPLF
jgi:hypothetical protein